MLIILTSGSIKGESTTKLYKHNISCERTLFQMAKYHHDPSPHVGGLRINPRTCTKFGRSGNVFAYGCNILNLVNTGKERKFKRGVGPANVNKLAPQITFERYIWV